MKMTQRRMAPLGLALCLSAYLPQAASAQVSNPQLTQAVSNPTVCQWLSRNGNKLYLCGAASDVDAIIKEARFYEEPVSAALDSMAYNPIAAAPVKVDTNTLPVALLYTGPTLTKPKTQPKQKLNQVVNSGSKKTHSKGFMVQSLGQISEIKPRLIAISDKDYQVLRRKNRISLGIYSQYKNALRRQQSLAKLGIDSELIDRSSNTTAQVPLPTRKVIKHVEQKKSKIKKRNTSNHNGFLVASVDKVPVTLSLLSAAKDKHFQVLRSAPYANRVSLGIYNTRKFALTRQRAMLKHGIATVIINRGKDTGYATKTSQTQLVVAKEEAKEKTQIKLVSNQIPEQVPSQLQLDKVIQLISSN